MTESIRQRAEELLATWREHERRAESLTPGSPEYEAAVADAEGVRAAYQALVAEQVEAAHQLAARPTLNEDPGPA